MVERLAKIKQKTNSNISNWIGKFNNDYKKIAELNNISFNKFEVSEIQEISEFPEQISWNPPEHIKNITIKNFRRFSEIEINNIGQFNLIVGDNNVGKTSILEALLFTPQKDEYFKRLALAYAERIKLTRYLDEEKKERFTLPVDFINDFAKKDAGAKDMSFTLKEKRTKWKRVEL